MRLKKMAVTPNVYTQVLTWRMSVFLMADVAAL